MNDKSYVLRLEVTYMIKLIFFLLCPVVFTVLSFTFTTFASSSFPILDFSSPCSFHEYFTRSHERLHHQEGPASWCVIHCGFRVCRFFDSCGRFVLIVASDDRVVALLPFPLVCLVVCLSGLQDILSMAYEPEIFAFHEDYSLATLRS